MNERPPRRTERDSVAEPGGEPAARRPMRVVGVAARSRDPERVRRLTVMTVGVATLLVLLAGGSWLASGGRGDGDALHGGVAAGEPDPPSGAPATASTIDGANPASPSIGPSTTDRQVDSDPSIASSTIVAATVDLPTTGPPTTGPSPGVAPPLTSTIGGPAAGAAPTGADTLPTSSIGTASPAEGPLVLSATTLDLGGRERERTLSLRNTGDRSLSWSIDGEAAPFDWTSLSGSLAPGTGIDVVVSIDRDPLPEGSISRELTVSTGESGHVPFTVTASVDRRPVVSIVEAPAVVHCPDPTGAVVVGVSDESTITAVELIWDGRGGQGSIPMSPGAGGIPAWTGEVAPVPLDGDWVWTAVATDARGNVGMVGARFAVADC